jgi:hypothetical protein
MKKIISFVLLFLILGLLFPIQTFAASTIANQTRGQFLIQDNNDLWYVSPTKLNRSFIANSTTADKLIINHGIHINKTRLTQLQNNATKKYIGKILILGANHANAYYLSPVDRKVYFLGAAEVALSTMRSLANPISTEDIQQIKINPKFPYIQPPVVVPPVEPPPIIDSDLPTSNPAQIISSPTGQDSVLYRSISNLDYAAFPQDPGNDYPVSGKKIFVATNGTYNGTGTINDPLNSLFKAEQLSVSGDMIIMRGGEYLDCLPADYGCYKIALNKPNVILRNYPGETVSLIPSGISRHGLTVNNDNITIDGINLKNFTGTGIVLSWNNEHKNTIIKNLTVSNSQDGISAYGLQTGLLVKNVLVENSWLLGISCGIGPCKNWRLDRVIVKNQNNGGGSGADAIAIEKGDNFLFTNLEVTGAGADGIDTKGTRVAVFNANIHNVARNGIKFWQGGDLVNSIVSRTGADTSVNFATGGNYRILNSIIGLHNYDSQSTSYSLTVAYDHPTDIVNVDITNSIFYQNTGGIFFSPNTNLTLNNNLLQAGANNKVFEKSGFVVLGGDNISALSEFGTNNLAFNNNPQFISPLTNNYHVTNNSPLIDTGKNYSALPTFDITGNSRIIGTNPDIGPFER